MSAGGAAAGLIAIRDQLTDLQVSLARLAAGADSGDKCCCGDDGEGRQSHQYDYPTHPLCLPLEYVGGGRCDGPSPFGSRSPRRGGGVTKRHCHRCRPEGFDETFRNLPGGPKIATLTMAAQHLLYLAESRLSAQAQAVLEGDLGQDCGDAVPSVKLALEAYGQIATARENQGLFSAPEVGRLSVADAYYPKKPSGWQVFYATMTDFKTLREAIEPE